MMDIRQVTPGFAVAPQIDPADMEKLAAQGFACVICNRPDGEQQNQPDAAKMRAAAQAAGMEYHHIPVSGGEFPAEAVDAFRTIRTTATGPVLAYCRTGTRSITLETLANPASLNASDLIEQARNAGYDLSGMASQLST